MLGVTLAVLASFGTIVAFFSFTTTSYPFMLLLNVVVFAAAGGLGLMFLLQTLHRLSVAQIPPATAAAGDARSGVAAAALCLPRSKRIRWMSRSIPYRRGLRHAPAAGALDRLEGHILGPHIRLVFRIWVLVFALVGAQMSWILRPFIGSPNQPFTWFRPRQSNFFEAVANAISRLFGF